MWKNGNGVHDLPLRGQKVKVLRFTDPKVYRNECCQFKTRFEDLAFEKQTDASGNATATDPSSEFCTDASMRVAASDTEASQKKNKARTKATTPAAAPDTGPPMKAEPAKKKRKTETKLENAETKASNPAGAANTRKTDRILSPR
ncbi:hypothetical protein PR003_g12998 [Phytophthora rubi]|uniref:Uncharacterized protein n=1 Tax=Phytophthora rubi TaxID=129364 RepID=A0A6A3IBD1_9STRA|nr:hypothetical protein PR002_g24475 [Phytophthora rubi]KAE9036023.1 hypothetical protein PR001_g9041 [Phytophthora rubi]KAE9335468.1 hypothetical protein PR003_g12998 [Phytophthora rubi]